MDKIDKRKKGLFLTACLYHDIGKLRCDKEKYAGHESVGASVFRNEIAPQLGIDGEDLEYVCELITYHLDTFKHLLLRLSPCPRKEVMLLGLADLAACYMEHWYTEIYFLERLVPEELMTNELIAMRHLKDDENHHVTDMFTHSILCYHIASMLYEGEYGD